MQSELSRTNQNKARISRGASNAKLMAASSTRGSELFLLDLSWICYNTMFEQTNDLLQMRKLSQTFLSHCVYGEILA